jgi:hypothetical protein
MLENSMARLSIVALLVITLGTAVPVASGATVTLAPNQDSSIFQNNVNNSSGGANGLIAGTNANGSPRRALIAFDIAGNLPAGAVVQNVQLNLVLGAVAGGGGPGGGPASVSVGLHRLLSSWGEGVAQQQNPPTDSLGGQGQGIAASAGDVTWNSNFHGTSMWTTAGGDFESAASANAAIGTTLNSMNSWMTTAALVSDVQAWLDNPASNSGWLLRNADETTANTGRTFFSSEVATQAFRPQLEITYQVVPEPAAAAIGLFGAVLTIVQGRMKNRTAR